MDLPLDGDPCLCIFIQKLFQFPMDWGWKVRARFRKVVLFALFVNLEFAEFQCVGYT